VDEKRTTHDLSTAPGSNEKLSSFMTHQKTCLPTPLKRGQVLEKKEENAVFHRNLLCLPTTTNLN
jgi:hypothetical protein